MVNNKSWLKALDGKSREMFWLERFSFQLYCSIAEHHLPNVLSIFISGDISRCNVM
jgi:hypothetical protein